VLRKAQPIVEFRFDFHALLAIVEQFLLRILERHFGSKLVVRLIFGQFPHQRFDAHGLVVQAAVPTELPTISAMECLILQTRPIS